MEKQVYIAEEERVKFQKVVDAFMELYERENILVIDAGRYGFVGLKYYKSSHGFEYTNFNAPPKVKDLLRISML